MDTNIHRDIYTGIKTARKRERDTQREREKETHRDRETEIL